MLKGKGFYLTLAAGLFFAAGLLLSQAAATAQAAEAQEETAKEALPDESALRHYARTGAFERLEAEIRRLRALDPTWQPPEDLFDPAAELGFDEGPMWQLFAEGRYAELREAIAERRQEEPGWEPSDELRRQLDLAEAQQRLEHAAEHGQWKRVIEIAKAQPNLSSCQRVINSWTIAEAYSRSDDPDAGAEVYREILTRCDDSDILIATLQKASALLDDKRMLALHTTAEQRTDAIEDAQELRLALQQGRLAESLSEKEKVAPELLSSLADEARRSQDAETALNLGWYYAGQRQWQEAETWFKSAGEWGAGSAAVEGRVLA